MRKELKQLRDFINSLDGFTWNEPDSRTSKHPYVSRETPNGPVRITTVSCTGSDHHGMRNTFAQLRRAGVPIPYRGQEWSK
jgi:hypothetical protein